MLICGGPNTTAQNVVAGDSLKFATALIEILPNINKESLRQEFETQWNSEGLSLSQKEILVDLFSTLKDHRPQQNDLAAMVVYAQNNGNIDSEKMTRLLEVCQQLTEQHSSQNIGRVLARLRIFLLHNALYYSNFNQLIFIGGSYDFEFSEPEKEEAPSGTPEAAVV